ncbi:MAG: PepSY domain-containing protein, partial [Eubacteriales bacterium]|nr:PepSY domain-containing protein [Eubacteriales bacterium]
TVTEVQTTEAAKTQATEAAKVQTTEAATKTQTAKQVTEEQAVETALKDAGVTEAEITNLRVKKEIDDGVEEYNVDFYVENKEYEYEINASTGEIRSRDMEIDDDFVDSSEKSSALTEAEILKILQEKVPEVQEKDVRMKLEKERSGLVYEGEINMGFAKGEYEFEIDALTGQIIKWEEE